MRPIAITSALLLLPAAALAAASTPAPPIGDLFTTADRCQACHNQLSTAAGDDLSIGVDWRASMMANAARDPYWQAAVRREVMAHPTASVEIQHECSACHMPMARYHAKLAGGHGSVFTTLAGGAGATPEAALALDGVSCSLCHQISADGLGDPASFTAGFAIDATTPPGQRPAYGPFAVDPGRQRLMSSASGLVPAAGTHIQVSELCATCHTLFTHALDDQGRVVGRLPEQVPYLEWQHSAYRGTRSCQSCHLPEAPGEVVVSSVLGVPRGNVSRHVFRGGNFFMPGIFNELRQELGVAALPQELATTARRTADNLQSAAARVAIERAAVEAGTLTAGVTVANLAGHKLPSAYPSRRVWLHLVVADAAGQVLFESGALTPDGAIVGNDNDRDGARFEPHYDTIISADQVQVWEPILLGPDGVVTTVLLTASHYGKDNRLLPDGFDKGTAGSDIAVVGDALADDDFTAGSDRVDYVVAVGSALRPLTVTAELRYQPIGFRWARNLGQETAPEIDRFVAAYDRHAARSAITLASHTLTVD